MSPREHRASLRRELQEGSYCAQFKTYHDEMKENEEPPPNHNRLPRPLASGAGRRGAADLPRMNSTPTPMNETNEHNPDGLSPADYGAPEWRLLRVGESIIDGDELWHDNEWKLTQLGGRFTVKEVYEAYRRRISPTLADQSAHIAELERRVEELERENERLRTVLCESRKESSRAWGINTSQVAQIGMMSNIRAELESEISQLRAEVERLKGRNYNLEIANSSLQRERDEARSALKLKAATLAGIANDLVNARTQLAEREEDRKDLDWLAEELKQWGTGMLMGTLSHGTDLTYYVEIEGGFRKAPTLRAAIRAARAQPEDGK